MKIGIDFRLANISHRGMAKFCREIVRQLLAMDNNNTYILYIDGKININYDNTIAKYEYRELPKSNYIISEQFFLPWAVIKDKCDVLWCPNNTFPIFLPKRIKLIVTIHDLIYFYKPISKSSFYQKIGALYRKYNLKGFSKKISVATTVSNFSRMEIRKYLPQITKVVLTYNCMDDFIKNVSYVKGRETRLPNNNFFFTVSGDAPSKNLQTLINVFQKKYPDEILYIAGVKKGAAIRKKYNNIFFLDSGIATEVLIQYYLNCKCFIFPSIYEGFGIPIIEAMVCGKPIISTNVCSLPEILGDKGIQVEPTEEGIERGIKDFLFNYEKYDFDYKICLIRFDNWASSANQLLESCFQI